MRKIRRWRIFSGHGGGWSPCRRGSPPKITVIIHPRNDTAPPITTATTTAAPARGRGGRGGGIQINVVELKVVNGKLMYTNPGDPVYIDLGNQRELEQ